jgi:hypothetical protein
VASILGHLVDAGFAGARAKQAFTNGLPGRRLLRFADGRVIFDAARPQRFDLTQANGIACDEAF